MPFSGHESGSGADTVFICNDTALTDKAGRHINTDAKMQEEADEQTKETENQTEKHASSRKRHLLCPCAAAGTCCCQAEWCVF